MLMSENNFPQMPSCFSIDIIFWAKKYLKPELKDDGHVVLSTEASGEMKLLTISALELVSCGL